VTARPATTQPAPAEGTIDHSYRLIEKMVNHVAKELDIDVKVTRGRGWSTWAQTYWKDGLCAGEECCRVQIGIKRVAAYTLGYDEYGRTYDQPLMYVGETRFWVRAVGYDNWTVAQRLWQWALHEMGHIYGAKQYQAQNHGGRYMKALADLIVLFPFEEVMQAVQ